MPGTRNSGGRNAKGKQLHVLQGTFRGDRHTDQVIPDPPKGRPEPPKKLTADERAEWNRMVARLEQTGTLAIVDDAALFEYVQLFAETQTIKTDQIENRKLATALKRTISESELDGSDLVSAVKDIISLRHLANKATRDLRQGHMAMRQYLVEFGMTPSARSRVKLATDTPAAADPVKDKYFGGNRRA